MRFCLHHPHHHVLRSLRWRHRCRRHAVPSGRCDLQRRSREGPGIAAPIWAAADAMESGMLEGQRNAALRQIMIGCMAGRSYRMTPVTVHAPVTWGDGHSRQSCDRFRGRDRSRTDKMPEIARNDDDALCHCPRSSMHRSSRDCDRWRLRWRQAGQTRMRRLRRPSSFCPRNQCLVLIATGAASRPWHRHLSARAGQYPSRSGDREINEKIRFCGDVGVRSRTPPRTRPSTATALRSHWCPASSRSQINLPK